MPVRCSALVMAIATAPITIAAGMKMAMLEIQRRARAAPNAAHSRRRLAKASSKQTGRIMATPNISAMAASSPAASVVCWFVSWPATSPSSTNSSTNRVMLRNTARPQPTG